jgi:protein-S-isoprenylcysteine O-methyltransferase Ste14
MIMPTPQPSKIRISLALLSVLFLPFGMLYLSGNWLWIQGWIFSLWLVALCFTIFGYMYFYDPELLQERYKKPGSEGEKGWDRIFMYSLEFGFSLWFIIMPLDAERFGWTTNFPLYLEALGLVFLGACFYLFIKSYMDNTYLSPLVRIQSEREQKVISTGVYGWIRHPLYLGGIFMFLGGPLLLGSFYGFIIGVYLSFSLVGRTIGEERMLLEELDGYTDYKKKVKYRLIPYIW